VKGGTHTQRMQALNENIYCRNRNRKIEVGNSSYVYLYHAIAMMCIIIIYLMRLIYLQLTPTRGGGVTPEPGGAGSLGLGVL
jgi:hypothetical protein